VPYSRRVLTVASDLGARPEDVWDLEEGELLFLERFAEARQARQQRRLLSTIHPAEVRRLAAELERIEAIDGPEKPARDGPAEVKRKLAKLGVR
jgi:hypothetical protein